MNTSPVDQSAPIEEPSVFYNEYDKEVLIDNLKHDLIKTRNSLFTIGGVLLVGDLIGLAMANTLGGESLILVIVVPAIYIGLGFLAGVKPLLSMWIAAILFALIVAFSIYAYGASSIISGLLIKAVLVYFFIKSFNHAKEAEQARKTLAQSY